MASTEGFDIVRGAVTTFIGTEADGPYHTENLAPLYDVVTVELVNREIAGAFDQPYPPAQVSTRIAVTVIVLGIYDTGGHVVGPVSRRVQLITNLKHLITDVVAPVETGDGTATLHLYGPSGASEGSAVDVQFVGPLRPVPINPYSCAVTFDMLFPSGVPIS